MGTRHLIEVDVDGEPRVAQYGQRDGYPSGQGLQVLEFLRDVDLEKFKEKLKNVRFGTKEEIEELWESGGIQKDALSRDTGAGILRMVYDGNATILSDSRDFKDDHVFCEWYYIIDLDKGTLDVNGVKTYKLDKLPTDKKFLKDLDDE